MSVLEKALANLPDGKRLGQDGAAQAFDYSHLLPTAAQQNLEMRVSHFRPQDEPLTSKTVHVDVIDKTHPSGPKKVGQWIGNVNTDTKTVEPHVQLDPKYRGMGLGKAMYTAGYSHSKKHLGVTHASGCNHSKSADMVHRALSKEHDLGYVPQKNAGPDDAQKYPFAGYRYMLKSEGVPDPEEDALLCEPGCGHPMEDLDEDEVSRMLKHPDPVERLMALKLDSRLPKHLQMAAVDPDPSVYQYAIGHPEFGDDHGKFLTSLPQGALEQQRYFLSQGKANSSHLATLLHAYRGDSNLVGIQQLVASHPAATAEMLGQIFNDRDASYDAKRSAITHPSTPGMVLHAAVMNGTSGDRGLSDILLARLAVEHKNLFKTTIDSLVRSAVELPSPKAQTVAEHALANQMFVPKEVEDYLFTRVKLYPSEQHSRALLDSMIEGAGPRAAELKARALKELPGSAQNEVVAQGVNEIQQAPLAKSVPPEHFESIVKASDPEGKNLVDHTPDLNAHPPEIQHEVNAYHDHVLNSSQNMAPKGKVGPGITRKKVFSAPVEGHKQPMRFMAKPYHEKIIDRVKSWMVHPHQGWAEMTTQSMFHAGGIGHLHQKVHVSEHNMGPGHEKEPGLVVHLQPEYKSVVDGGANHYRQEKNGADLRKIVLMDFLANNHDRHAGNMMFHKETGAPLAIDHSRNFQYKKPLSHHVNDDTFDPYMDQSGVMVAERVMDPRISDPYQRKMDLIDRYAPAFEWWDGVSDKVKKAFHDRLSQIKDPHVQEHLKRNFDERAKYLDDRGKHGLENFGLDWNHDKVPHYQPDELTDDQKDDPEYVKAHFRRIREKQDAKKAARKALRQQRMG